MSLVAAQAAVAEYHHEMAQQGHHGGHNMYLFHRDWHQQNRDPVPPPERRRDWGTNLVFGTNFLQMHHEMVKATDQERKFHMLHPSLVSWYRSKGYDIPAEWDPLSPIPEVLGYSPDPAVFPDEIRAAVENAARQRGVTPEQFLRRQTQRPAFTLPPYFTRTGAAPGAPGEPYTGCRKLADFQNTNQLGCCIVFPHNRWHGAIGGAMGSTWTAIADPIFYFGVHWHIDKVFDEYKLIHAERGIRPLDFFSLRSTDALETEGLPSNAAFTPEEEQRRQEDMALSDQLNQPL